MKFKKIEAQVEYYVMTSLVPPLTDELNLMAWDSGWRFKQIIMINPSMYYTYFERDITWRMRQIDESE